MTLRAIIYTRVSSGQQVDNTSLETQEAICRSFAASHGYEVTQHFSDKGISGELYTSRPGIQSALREIESKKAEALIIFNVSRSGRDLSVILDIAKRVHKSGAKLFFTDQGEVVYDGVNKATFAIKGVFADMEREAIKERTIRGSIATAQAGRMPSRNKPPLGYHIITSADVITGKHTPEEVGTYILTDEAPMVAEIFERYARGETIGSISRWLVTTYGKDCGEIPNRTLLHILSNPVYKGTPAYGKTRRMTDESRTREGKGTNYTVKVHPSEWIYLEAPAIVSSELWQTVQYRTQSNRERLGGVQRRKRVLAGLAVHAPCNRKLHTHSINGTDYYRCDGCQHHIKADELDERVLFTIESMMYHKDKIYQVIYTFAEKQNQESPVSIRRKEKLSRLSDLQDTNRKYEASMKEASKAGLSTVRFLRYMDEVDKEIGEIEIELLELNEKLEKKINPEEENREIDKAIRTLEILLTDNDSMTLTEKYGILSAVVNKVTLQQDYHCPLTVSLRVAGKPYGVNYEEGIGRDEEDYPIVSNAACYVAHY